MPKAVAPWTWRHAIRDHGPESPGLLLALLVLATYMDKDGFAYPGQPTWAKGARKSVRMIQNYIAQARRLGWISVVNAGRGGKGWAFNGYRACVPDWLDLNEKDENIADAIQAECGEIKEGTAIAIASPKARENPEETQMVISGDEISNGMVTKSRALGTAMAGDLVPQQLLRTNSYSENSRFRTHASEEAPLARRAVPGIDSKTADKSEKKAAERTAAIDDLLHRGYGWNDVVKFTSLAHGTTLEHVIARDRVRADARDSDPDNGLGKWDRDQF